MIEKKVCKGIKRNNNEKIKFQMYKKCLINSETTTETVYGIVSKNLKLYTVELKKTALSPYDDKRYLVNNIDTLPYGHYSLVSCSSSS